MCGRYTLSDPGDLLLELDVVSHLPIEPRYNIAPTQAVLAIRGQDADPRPQAVQLRWGLVPYWAKDPSIGNRMINARSETAAEKPSFKQALKKRRCLIPTDGFYEWVKVGKAKQPYHIHLPQRRPFVFAGLWERWTRGPEPLETCTILTTAANDDVRPVHDRMPVILEGEARLAWLDPELQDSELLTSMLGPLPAGRLQLTAVSTLVNNPRNDSAACLEPLADAPNPG